MCPRAKIRLTINRKTISPQFVLVFTESEPRGETRGNNKPRLQIRKGTLLDIRFDEPCFSSLTEQGSSSLLYPAFLLCRLQASRSGHPCMLQQIRQLRLLCSPHRLRRQGYADPPCGLDAWGNSAFYRCLPISSIANMPFQTLSVLLPAPGPAVSRGYSSAISSLYSPCG